MSEQVQTGGLMQFRYPKERVVALDPERRKAIGLGYAQADERKSKEKKNKIIFWIIVILIIIGILTYILLKK
ncbi:MAG: hypothetical protein AABX85_03020 [Nanoarchaeota archaeon]